MRPGSSTLPRMALLLLVMAWIGYLAWVMSVDESSRRAHLVVAWALLAVGVLVELIVLLL